MKITSDIPLATANVTHVVVVAVNVNLLITLILLKFVIKMECILCIQRIISPRIKLILMICI